MVEGFKVSLSHINRLLWASISVSIALFLITPSEPVLSLFGNNINLSETFLIIPFSLIGLLLARFVMICHTIEIIKFAQDGPEFSDMQKLVLSYPIPEFIGWKFRKNLLFVHYLILSRLCIAYSYP